MSFFRRKTTPIRPYRVNPLYPDLREEFRKEYFAESTRGKAAERQFAIKVLGEGLFKKVFRSLENRGSRGKPVVGGSDPSPKAETPVTKPPVTEQVFAAPASVVPVKEAIQNDGTLQFEPRCGFCYKADCPGIFSANSCELNRSEALLRADRLAAVVSEEKITALEEKKKTVEKKGAGIRRGTSRRATVQEKIELEDKLKLRKEEEDLRKMERLQYEMLRERERDERRIELERLRREEVEVYVKKLERKVEKDMYVERMDESLEKWWGSELGGDPLQRVLAVEQVVMTLGKFCCGESLAVKKRLEGLESKKEWEELDKDTLRKLIVRVEQLEDEDRQDGVSSLRWELNKFREEVRGNSPSAMTAAGPNQRVQLSGRDQVLIVSLVKDLIAPTQDALLAEGREVMRKLSSDSVVREMRGTLLEIEKRMNVDFRRDVLEKIKGVEANMMKKLERDILVAFKNRIVDIEMSIDVLRRRMEDVGVKKIELEEEEDIE